MTAGWVVVESAASRQKQQRTESAPMGGEPEVSRVCRERADLQLSERRPVRMGRHADADAVESVGSIRWPGEGDA